MESITSKIFMDLDIKSLSSAEEASVVWASVIEEGKLWEKLYKDTVGSIFILIYVLLFTLFVVFSGSSVTLLESNPE